MSDSFKVSCSLNLSNRLCHSSWRKEFQRLIIYYKLYPFSVQLNIAFPQPHNLSSLSLFCTLSHLSHFIFLIPTIFSHLSFCFLWKSTTRRKILGLHFWSGSMDAKYIFGQCNLIKLSTMQIKSHPGCENIDMELIPIIKTAMTIALK